MHASYHCIGTILSLIDLLTVLNGVDRLSASLDKNVDANHLDQKISLDSRYTIYITPLEKFLLLSKVVHFRGHWKQVGHHLILHGRHYQNIYLMLFSFEVRPADPFDLI